MGHASLATSQGCVDSVARDRQAAANPGPPPPPGLTAAVGHPRPRTSVPPAGHGRHHRPYVSAPVAPNPMRWCRRRFALDGASYEIDLNAKNAAALRKRSTSTLPAPAAPTGPPVPAVTAQPPVGRHAAPTSTRRPYAPGRTNTASTSAAEDGSPPTSWTSTGPQVEPEPHQQTRSRAAPPAVWTASSIRSRSSRALTGAAGRKELSAQYLVEIFRRQRCETEASGCRPL